MSFSFRVWIAFVVLALVAPLSGYAAPCSSAKESNSAVAKGSSTAAAKPATIADTHGIVPGDMDTSASPCKDFYEYTGGGWMKANPVPAAYPTWGRFNELQNRNQEILRQILEDAAKNRNAAAGSIDQKIGDYYASCMNTVEIEAQGAKPLGPELVRIAGLTDGASLQTEIAHLQASGVGALFFFSSEQDFKDSTRVIGLAGQGGLSLPDRDYYTKTDEKSQKLREGLVAHVAKMFALMGDDAATAAAEAKTVLDIETRLAEASMTRVERRNPNNIYHKMDRAALKALTPNLSWEAYFKTVGFPGIEEVNVSQPDFFKRANDMLASVPMADWRTYLRWHFIHRAAPNLSEKFVNEDFDFYGRTLTGTTELQPRWKRCVGSTDRALGEDLGQKYVTKAFPPEAKAAALQMVHNLIAALREDLQTLPWMSDATRKQALAKLSAFTIKIGYPDQWRDYSAYKVNRGPYVLNSFGANDFDFKRNLAQIGKPVDRTEWGMSPPTVNAYYNPTMNEIVFPAGILQPPFYDPKADDASNYGGMGSVIGHEMTHGFDDSGSQFDAQGNLKNWWTPEDHKNFEERAECVQKQFDGYAVEGDLHENGKLVLGESIADLGGLTVAHIAFGNTAEGKNAEQKIDGYTREQRFFISFAQIWSSNVRPEYARLMVATNPHPLGKFRAIGAPSNMQTFYDAFSCKEGDPMVRPAAVRCKIW
jgi:putative endopeptidase